MELEGNIEDYYSETSKRDAENCLFHYCTRVYPNEIDLAARAISQPIDYLSVVVYPVGYGTLFYLISKLISAIQTSIILRI